MTEQIHTTTCVMDCPDTCSLDVEVADDRVVAIRPGESNPDTGGFICSKVSDFTKRLYHADRILQPLRRVGPKGEGKFEPVSWTEAIEEMAGRFAQLRDEHGGESILPFHYGGSNGMLTDEFLDDLFFARLGASRLDKTICAAPATEVAVGMYGKMPGVAFADFVHADCIVIWGANPRGSNIHLIPHLREARKRGAKVITIDPRRNLSRSEHSLHLPVLPGQDLPVALAMINWWEERGGLDRDFLAAHADGLEPLLASASEWTLERAAEVSGLEANDIEQAAATMLESRPLLVRCGWGIERNANGGQAVAAVLAIPALLGAFGVRGGGYTLSNGGATRFDPTPILGDVDWSTRKINMSQLGRVLDPDAESPVRALFVYNANPVATVPDQPTVIERLKREDLFTVVHEQVMTDTARYADLLLPATTFLEGWDLRGGYGSYVVGGVRPAVPAAGEARSNMQLFAELGRAMGFDDPAFQWDDETLVEKAIGLIEMAGGSPDLELLMAGRQARHDFPGQSPIQFENVFPQTSDSRIHLTPDQLGDAPYSWQPPANGYPLALISPASAKLVTSTMGEFNLDTLRVTLHPDDAAERELSNGAQVRVFNDQGDVHCVLEISDRVRRSVASMPKGAWSRSSINGATSVALCPDDAQVVGDGACFNDARVEVVALG